MATAEPDLLGKVIHGAHRGQNLGFPTANLDIDSNQLPPSGVYAARVRIEGEQQWRPAAANIGTNPTFGERIRKLEIYLLDYQGDLYGKTLAVQLVHFLRSEIRFVSRDALIEQMRQDCRQAAELLDLDQIEHVSDLRGWALDPCPGNRVI